MFGACANKALKSSPLPDPMERTGNTFARSTWFAMTRWQYGACGNVLPFYASFFFLPFLGSFSLLVVSLGSVLLLHLEVTVAWHTRACRVSLIRGQFLQLPFR